MYGSGVKEVHITYRPGRLNGSADALSRSPQASQRQKGGQGPQEDQGLEEEVQMAVVASDTVTDEMPNIDLLLGAEPAPVAQESFGVQQRKDPKLLAIMDFLEKDELPANPTQACKVAVQAPLLVIKDGTLYLLDSKQSYRKRAVVPCQLHTQILEESHRTALGGHFSGKRTYSVLVHHWWWEGMYADTLRFARSCPECAVVTGGGRSTRPPLHPIPVQRPFQIIGVDVMDLPVTKRGNRHVLVFQDFLTKWPLVFPLPDQKAIRIATALVEEVIPLFGVPEALLSDRGANLLSHLMKDVCSLLGVKKLNTTAYHPGGKVQPDLEVHLAEAYCSLRPSVGPVFVRGPLGISQHAPRGNQGKALVPPVRGRLEVAD